MPLKPGARLGNYEIVAAIGAGGMGEVYRARDARLGREVAIKVLPEAFARDAERMLRFEQEARAVAALNHPNVLSVFDIGTQDGVPYLVSELLEGESLRDVLRTGPITSRKAVEYARQIADGLAAAHEKKIVHRDLKPENLFLSGGGRLKILDFGLAKMPVTESAAAGVDAATATIVAVTSPGVVMGTTGYMAPEQVRGDAVDHRADIFSFGATLYEMLTGKRAFQGDSSIETLNAILKEDPPEFDSEKLHVSPGLERIVRHCLEKRPGERFQSARDLTFALSALSDPSGAVKARPAGARVGEWRYAAVAAIAALLGAGIGFWAVRRPEPADRTEFSIAVSGEVNHLAISRDGKWLAYVSPGVSDAIPTVYVQRVGSPSVRAIQGSEGGTYPFWSPDNQYVAFFANGKLRKAPLAGGNPQTVTTVGIAPRGGSWGSKGVILYSPDSGGPLWRVNADGSGARPATKMLSSTESSHRWPLFLADGDHFLMFGGNFSEVQDNANAIHLGSLSNSKSTPLVNARSSAGYADGRLFYVDASGALTASTLDIAGAKVSGAPQVIAVKVARSPSTYYSSFAIAENSTLVYSADNVTNHSQLTWFDESGKETGKGSPVSVLANPALSPDGKWVAYDSNDFKAGNVDVWINDFVRGGSRFTFNPAEEVTPIWSRDGSTIAYRTLGNVVPMVQLKKASGLEPEKSLSPLGDASTDIMANSWSVDGREILCNFQTSKGTWELVVVPVDGGKPRPFLSGLGNKMNGQISPDGKWVAYASNETGDWEIYATTYPAAAGKWQVSRGGGSEPRWRGDGKAIFYIGPRQMLTEMVVSTEGTFSTAAVRSLFPVHARPPISSTDIVTYDVTRDGKHFLVNQYVRPDQPAPLTVVMHAANALAR
uniref:Serine/threonine protein kinase n=1 Tax=Solibacter usitatus (strain Ellin6076) TaxID=234267 RepID=Q01XW9_SOLUE